MATFRFCEDKRGGVGMEIIAENRVGVFNATVTALCLYMWDQDAVDERQKVTLTTYGFNARTTLVALLSEILLRTELDGFVFKRFETSGFGEVPEAERVQRHQYQLTGFAYGEPFDPARHRLLRPVRAVLITGLRLRRTGEGLQFYCVLDA